MHPKLLLLAITALASACADGGSCGGSPPERELAADHPLRNPDAAAMKQVPPDTFDVRFETTQGDVTVRVFREWAPLGAYRFYNLVRNGFYDGSRFFRVLPGFAAQFGAHGRPEVDQVWHKQRLPDDPRRASNRAGTLSFAKLGENSRTTQLFFNYRDNEALDADGFAPIGRIVDGMPVLYLLYSEYGDTPPQGSGPAFACILSHGNDYLDRKYPRLDRIERAIILDGAPSSTQP